MKIPNTVEEARKAMGLPDVDELENTPLAESEPEKSGAGSFILKFGLFVAAICPIIGGIGMLLWQAMPGCIGGSGGPASGCFLFGLNFNWLIQLSIAALVGSFLTVPIGVVITILGAIVCIFEGRKK